MHQNIFAHTAPGHAPGFVSINREANGDISVHVRSAPTTYEGIRVCGVDCKPGAFGCNNYCNMHPDKTLPMADCAEPMTHTEYGSEASFTVPAEEWAKLVSAA